MFFIFFNFNNFHQSHLQVPICCSISYSNYTIKLVNNSTAALEYMRKVRTVFCPDFLAQSYINSAFTASSACALQAFICRTHSIWFSAFSCSVTPLRFTSSGTISSMRFRAASLISEQYCLTHAHPLPGCVFANVFTQTDSELQNGSLYPLFVLEPGGYCWAFPFYVETAWKCAASCISRLFCVQTAPPAPSARPRRYFYVQNSVVCTSYRPVFRRAKNSGI